MKKIQYRKMQMSDIEAMSEMRMEQLIDEGSEVTCDLKPKLKDYYLTHLPDKTFIGLLAIYDEEVIGTSGLSILEKVPYFSNPTGKIGELSSVFVLHAYRRQGIATELLTRIIDEAKNNECSIINVSASKLGAHLYKRVGFTKKENYYTYVINKG